MKGMMQGFLFLTVAIVGVLVIALIIQGGDFFLYKKFAPKYEAARRETFEKSKAYNQGMTQEIENMAFQYAQAGPEAKAALASLILHRVADFDLAKLPPDDRAFVERLREERLHPAVTP